MRFIALIVLVSGCAKDVVHPDEVSGGFNLKWEPEAVDWLSVKVGAQQHNYNTDQILRQKTVRLSCRTPMRTITTRCPKS